MIYLSESIFYSEEINYLENNFVITIILAFSQYLLVGQKFIIPNLTFYLRIEWLQVWICLFSFIMIFFLNGNTWHVSYFKNISTKSKFNLVNLYCNWKLIWIWLFLVPRKPNETSLHQNHWQIKFWLEIIFSGEFSWFSSPSSSYPTYTWEIFFKKLGSRKNEKLWGALGALLSLKNCYYCDDMSVMLFDHTV